MCVCVKLYGVVNFLSRTCAHSNIGDRYLLLQRITCKCASLGLHMETKMRNGRRKVPSATVLNLCANRLAGGRGRGRGAGGDWRTARLFNRVYGTIRVPCARAFSECVRSFVCVCVYLSVSVCVCVCSASVPPSFVTISDCC